MNRCFSSCKIINNCKSSIRILLEYFSRKLNLRKKLRECGKWIYREQNKIKRLWKVLLRKYNEMFLQTKHTHTHKAQKTKKTVIKQCRVLQRILDQLINLISNFSPTLALSLSSWLNSIAEMTHSVEHSYGEGNLSIISLCGHVASWAKKMWLVQIEMASKASNINSLWKTYCKNNNNKECIGCQ